MVITIVVVLVVGLGVVIAAVVIVVGGGGGGGGTRAICWVAELDNSNNREQSPEGGLHRHN